METIQDRILFQQSVREWLIGQHTMVQFNPENLHLSTCQRKIQHFCNLARPQRPFPIKLTAIVIGPTTCRSQVVMGQTAYQTGLWMSSSLTQNMAQTSAFRSMVLQRQVTILNTSCSASLLSMSLESYFHFPVFFGLQMNVENISCFHNIFKIPIVYSIG